MKNLEIFYTEDEALTFVSTLVYENADSEIIHTFEPNEKGEEIECWAVYFNPKRMG